jgi:hypothetical protein
MARRVIFVVLTLFWVTMNVLLWRSEIRGLGSAGAPVAVRGVLDRVLTAPDPSTLEVVHRGRSLGYVHWYPDSGGEESENPLSSAYVPEGMVRRERGLELRLDGNVLLPDRRSRIQFDVGFELTPKRDVHQFTLAAAMRPVRLEITMEGPARQLTWRLDNAGAQSGGVLSLEDSGDLTTFLNQLGLPLIPAPLTTLPASTPAADLHEWEARLDWLRLGRSQVRCYRLRLRLLEQFEIIAYVNRAGELLRIELPGEVRLYNSALVSF